MSSDNNGDDYQPFFYRHPFAIVGGFLMLVSVVSLGVLVRFNYIPNPIPVIAKPIVFIPGGIIVLALTVVAVLVVKTDKSYMDLFSSSGGGQKNSQYELRKLCRRYMNNRGYMWNGTPEKDGIVRQEVGEDQQIRLYQFAVNPKLSTSRKAVVIDAEKYYSISHDDSWSSFDQVLKEEVDTSAFIDESNVDDFSSALDDAREQIAGEKADEIIFEQEDGQTVKKTVSKSSIDGEEVFE